MRESAGVPPRNGRRFIVVGRWCSTDNRCIEDRDDVRRLVSVGIGQPILGATQDSENRSEPESYPGLLLGFTKGSLLRRLIGLNGSTNGRPKPGVDQSDEKHPAAVIPRKYGGRRKDEKFVPDEVP